MKARSQWIVWGAMSATVALAPPAWAVGSKTQIAVDLDFAHTIREPFSESGGGGQLRLGQQLDLVALSLTGEFGLGYHSFGSGDRDAKDYTAVAGGRLSIGKVLEPGIFAHVGVSRLVDEPSSSWAPLLDAGLFLDLTLLPLLDIGVHGSYVHRFETEDTSPFRYVMVGPHAALLF